VNLKSKLPTRFQKYASFGVIPKLFFLPIAVFFVALIFMTRPFIKIQIYSLDWQIGHLIPMCHANELRDKTWNKNHRRKKVSVYCMNGPIASRYAIRKLRESVLCCRGHFAWLLIQISKFVPLIHVYFSDDRDFGTNFESTPLVKFNKSEIELGTNLIGNYKPLVCLNVRDTAYNSFARHELGFPASDWTHRNSDIDTYRDAATYLTKHGYSVFRMGARVEKSLTSNDSKIIDYAKNGMRSEFLDFYLARECHFAISTSSGWDEIPTMFHRPLLLVNHFDFLMTLSKSCLIYPKVFFDTVSERQLSLNETVGLHLSGKTNQKKYSIEDFGIEVRDLSSEELVEAVTEMAQRVEGTFVETPEQKEMQAKLKHILSTHPKLQPSPNYYPIRSQFASCFLSRYPNFLD
jgi:putative glycosyltransferase (TIGR04372 family)